ncbi:MAG TPA: Ppx/GppA phosphatase family protein [Verrucomicrobiae bacterium]|jgi:exopolyphosphatase/guanosine-5'-triphosphate,3'-diphosphate pyrophosphatase
MAPIRRAVIDVGTNSVKVLVAEVSDEHVRPLWEEGEQTRLGRGFYESHRLLPEAIELTAQAVAKFADMARSYRADSTRILATSAARDAVNQGELVEAIERRSGLKVEIISGEQEADLVYQGVTSDQSFGDHQLLIMDVGGGSTEFILGIGQHALVRESFSLGSVRLLEHLRPTDPPAAADLPRCREWLRAFMAQNIHPVLGALLAEGRPATHLIGTGGSASILARMASRLDDFDREVIEATRLQDVEISNWTERLWSLSLAERKHIIGLPKKRADVILAGAAIYEAVMRDFAFPELRVSTRGLRFAAVMQA